MKPLTRKERIEILLDHWDDFFDVNPRDPDSGGEGNGWRISRMSEHPSVIELDRALEALQAFAPRKFEHLRGFYGAKYRATVKPKLIRGRRGKHRGKTAVAATPEYGRERVVPRWVRRQKVRDAVALLAQPLDEEQYGRRPWCFRGDPSLPKPLIGCEPPKLGVDAVDPLVAA